jgi:uncharacterized protein (TIGR03437 family)
VAPYELVSLVGAGIGPQSPVSAEIVNGAVPTTLGGVQVLFDGTPAPLLYAGPTQINAIVPAGVYADANTALQIVGPKGTINGPGIPVQASQPGVFVTAVPDYIFPSPGVALNQDGSVNSATNPAVLGSIVSVWMSGAGISTGDQSDGVIVARAGHPTLPISVFSFAPLAVVGVGELLPGSLSLEVLYAGDAVGMVAGVTQINFRLPAQFEGLNVTNLAFAARVGDATSNGFTLYVKPAQ